MVCQGEVLTTNPSSVLRAPTTESVPFSKAVSPKLLTMPGMTTSCFSDLSPEAVITMIIGIIQILLALVSLCASVLRRPGEKHYEACFFKLAYSSSQVLGSPDSNKWVDRCHLKRFDSRASGEQIHNMQRVQPCCAISMCFFPVIIFKKPRNAVRAVMYRFVGRATPSSSLNSVAPAKKCRICRTFCINNGGGIESVLKWEH